MTETAPLARTPLYDAHVALGARMVPFAGYEMPVQYTGPHGGVLNEHRWTRENAGLFDVSHMGQARLTGAAPLMSFEKLTPGDFVGLKEGKQRYSLLLNEAGGILDDLMAGRPDHEGLFIVVNAGTKHADFDLIERTLAAEAHLRRLDDRALLALQGPKAAEVLARWIPEAAKLSFMETTAVRAFDGLDLIVSRSGYTGEDGYEISIPAIDVSRIWMALLNDERVRPIGLGARDSLRLEAGLPLYGHDVDETTSPAEAGLMFAVNKRRRENRDFRGAERILAEAAGAMSRVRVGFKVLEGAPAREGAEIADAEGNVVGKVTSGAPSPSLGGSVGMGYVPPSLATPGTPIKVIVRGRAQAAEIAPTPFHPHRYARKV
ncbi:MAG TPA: glycine cleavage system aminomethyltransferase GcvT [Caulobacteraceae bacterium]|jgi:aminomethyltransferase